MTFWWCWMVFHNSIFFLIRMTFKHQKCLFKFVSRDCTYGLKLTKLYLFWENFDTTFLVLVRRNFDPICQICHERMETGQDSEECYILPCTRHGLCRDCLTGYYNCPTHDKCPACSAKFAKAMPRILCNYLRRQKFLYKP